MAEITEEQIKEVVEAAKLIVQALDVSVRADDEINLAATTSDEDLKFERIKAGRILVLEHLSGHDDTSAPTRIRVGYWNGHRLNWLKTQPAPIASETVDHSARVYLREGMYPVVRFEGCTDGDDIYATLNGYWIKA